MRFTSALIRSLGLFLILGPSVLVDTASAQAGDREGDPQTDLPADLVIPPAPVLTPEEQLATFELPPGFVIELVAAEPLVVDPVQITFDEFGRLWVVEMTGYMRDVDGTGEHDRIGTIAVLTDDDGDGTMDTRAEFASGLVMPRGVVPLHGGALCVLPPEVVFLRDDDGDGTFDTREVVATGLTAGLENPEHAINSPMIGIDNWIHFANWDKRVRRVFSEAGDPSWEIEPVRGGGQWGLSMDDLGRFMRNTNPNPLFCDIVPSHYAVRNDHLRRFQGAFASVKAKNATYPSRINPGVNRGYQPKTLRDNYTLAKFTAACSPTALRGMGLGKDANGDVFVCEPAANLVKRYELTPTKGSAQLVAKSLHAKNDFLTSTHERFRPVGGTTGPDGALYLADMYRGLIQHRIFLTSFLRKQVLKRGLDAPMGQGRVWRVRKQGAHVARPKIDIVSASLVELAEALGSENSWVRDQAQRLLVESISGEASVLKVLRRIAVADAAIPAIHALWTLDGVGYITPEVLTAALGAKDPRVRCVATEIAGPWLDLEGNDLLGIVAQMALQERDPRARLYALLSLGESVSPKTIEIFSDRMTADASSSLERSAVLSGLEFREALFLDVLAQRDEWRKEAPGRKELIEELSVCIGKEALYAHLELAVDYALQSPAEWWSDPLVKGLYSTRRKGPKGQKLPIPLRAMPVALASSGAQPSEESIEASIMTGCTWPGKPGAVEIEVPRELTTAELLQYERGASVFAEACASCHQAHGGGQDGKAPTLRGTRYVVGEESRLIKILMHGMQGPVEIDDQTWNLEMPRYEGSDEDLAAALTYIRRSWGNGADPVLPAQVTSQRAKSKGRTKPMTAKEK